MHTTDTDVIKMHVERADLDWFAAHPTAAWRRRLFIPAEAPNTATMRPCVTHTIVFRRRDGSLVRRYCGAVDA